MNLLYSYKIKEGQDPDAHLHPLTNIPTKCQPSTPYRMPRNSPDKILKLVVTTTRSEVKSRSHHDVAHLQPPNYVVPT